MKNIRARSTLVVVALAILGVTSCEKPGVRAARENEPDLTSRQIEAIDDDTFLVKAQKAEITQTTLSQLAMEHSQSRDVRAYALQVITNYRQALVDLTDLMKAKNIARTFADEEIQLEATNRLHGLSGSAFDREYVSLMTAEQQAAVAMFRSVAETGSDPDVRNYAQTVLPSLRKDFDTAAALEKKLASQDQK